MEVIYEKFDSEIFGIKIGKLSSHKSWADGELYEAITNAKKEGFSQIFMKIGAEQKKETNQALNFGFKLVDTQIIYEIAVSNLWRVQNNIVSYRRQVVSDIKEIMNIARNSFVLDQFHSDDNLDNELCDRYYEQWAKNSCEGFADEVFVSSFKDVLTGFITLDFYGEDTASVGLAAIKPEFRHKGYFNNLIGFILQYLNNERIARLRYGTQISNYPVLKTMANYNGRPIECIHVLHIKL